MDEVKRNGHHEGARSRGSAVQIVNVKTLPNATSRFILEKAPFRQILSEVGKRPIYLLSIAGASRQGKSFLMNVILHYLEELEKGAAGGGVDAWDSIASLHSLDGFHIENRNVRDTIGFWMWSKPFVFKQSNGQEIAILLMDTQGVFDKFSTKREWAMIVGLSLLTSSCLIYNLQNNLLEDNLEIFTNFAEFGMLSLQGNENATSVFQKLLFLIRDWGFPNDNPYGSVGGSTFIQEQLKIVSEMPEELQKVRKTLRTVFEEIECFLLPHPGNAAKENNYSGSLRPLEPVFLKNLKSFLENLIIIDELKPLHIGGNPVAGVELMAYFSKYIELLNGQKIPKAASLQDATVEANLDSIVEDCISFVAKEIEKAMTENDFFPLKELKVICERYFHEGIERFKQKVVGQDSKQVSKYSASLTNDLKKLMNGCARKNDEMKTAFILKLLDNVEAAYKKKIGDAVMNTTHSEQDFEEILEKCKEEVVDKVDFGDRNEDFFTEVMPQVRAVFSKLDESYRQTNSERLQTVESNYKKCFDDLLRDYDDRMETAVPDDELDSITPMKLAKSHEKCEEKIVTLFLSGTKFDNENIQKKAVADLKAQTAARLAKKSKKVQQVAQSSSSEALQIMEKAMKRYHDGMAALMRNGSPTDVQIQEKHELQRMMAETEFSSVVYVVKSREESSRLKALLERKIQEELESIQSEVRKQREQFRSRWNGQVDDAGKKYSEQMKSMLDSPKISSDSELKAHHEKLIERIVHEAAQDSWLPPESREQMQSEVRQRLLDTSGNFFSQQKSLLREAEESARNDICLFTKSHENALKDRINSGKDSMTEEEFKRIHEHLLGESKLQFESKWSQRLPKNSVVKLMDQFLNHGEGIFSTNMKTVQSLVRDKMKGIQDIIKECSETYEMELDDKMDSANNSGDLGVLEKYHKSAKMKAEKEFKKAMKEYASFPKAEEMKSELEKEILKIFEKKKESLENNLVKLAQGMGDLGNSALEFYHREMSNRKMDVSSEEALRAAHKEVLERAIKQFERNLAGTLGNLTVAKLQDEKNKLEEKLAEELPLQLEEWNKMDQAIDTETRKVMHGVIKGYTEKMENKLQPYAYVSKQFLQLEHEPLLQEGLSRIKTAKKPKSKEANFYENQIQNELNQLFEGYARENDANQRRVEESIVRSSEERKEAFFSSIKQITNPSVVKKQREEFVRELKESCSRAHHVSEDRRVEYEEMCGRMITGAVEEVTQRLNQLEPPEAEVELAVRDMMKSYKKQMDAHVSDESPLLPAKSLHGLHNRAESRVMKELGEISGMRLTLKVTERMRSALAVTFNSYKEMNDLKAAEGMESAIGIDLGTTYSCVGVYRKGKVEIIPERNGHKKTIPSYVLFEPDTDNVVVGDSAKDQSQIHPHLAIFDSKRLIGRWFSDKDVRQDMKLWPFKVVKDDKTRSSDRPKIQVEDKTYFPEEISAKILQTLKANAEAHLGHPVKKAVITVPAYFTDAQKKGTRNAAELAGLEVLELLSEPTSAAIAYNLKLNSEDDGDKAKNIFVYDLGGGTFDVSVLTSAKGKLEVKAVGGNNHLGGQDFDNLMVRFCIDEFERKHGVKVDGPGATGSTLDKSVRLRRIRHKCEELKKNLSEVMGVRVILDRLHGDLDMDVEVTREQFNRMIESLLQETIELARRALVDAKITVNDIGEVILGKGSVMN
jgi:actin-like ATPase involved in cell morphogenesis